MSRKHWWLALAALVVLAALPALAGEQGKCSGSTQDCLNHMAAKYAERGWVGLELDKNDYGAMTVKRVIPDSPAAAAGFRAGDMLVAFNGVGFGEENHEAMKKTYAAMVPGNKVTYTVKRDGGKRDIAVTLSQAPEEVIAQWVGRHLLEDHVVMAKAEY